QHFLVVGSRWRGSARRIESLEDILVVLHQAEELGLLLLYDSQVSPHGEVYHGGSDVPHVRLVVDQRARFGWTHAVGRLVLHYNRQTPGILSHPKPQDEHAAEEHDRTTHPARPRVI